MFLYVCWIHSGCKMEELYPNKPTADSHWLVIRRKENKTLATTFTEKKGSNILKVLLQNTFSPVKKYLKREKEQKCSFLLEWVVKRFNLTHTKSSCHDLTSRWLLVNDWNSSVCHIAFSRKPTNAYHALTPQLQVRESFCSLQSASFPNFQKPFIDLTENKTELPGTSTSSGNQKCNFKLKLCLLCVWYV